MHVERDTVPITLGHQLPLMIATGVTWRLAAMRTDPTSLFPSIPDAAPYGGGRSNAAEQLIL